MSEVYPSAFALMKKYDITPKKSFGQNFLISERVFRGIVDAVVQEIDDVVIEFGAGVGTLTARLSERVPEGLVVAVERERDMLTILNGELSQYDNVQIHEGDAMKFDVTGIAKWQGRPVSVCGNLPYNIASQIMIALTAKRNRSWITRCVFLIQKEMADRLLASPGTKAYGPLGVIISAYYNITSVVKAGPNCFVPAPRVHSTAVQLIPKTELWEADDEWFRKTVHAALGHRRKTLRNSLRQVFADDHVDQSLHDASIEGGVRGETLPPKQLGKLSEALRKNNPRS